MTEIAAADAALAHNRTLCIDPDSVTTREYQASLKREYLASLKAPKGGSR